MNDAAPGRNEPNDPIVILQANLAEKHKPLLNRRDELLAAAAKWPDKIETEEEAQELGDLAGRGGMILKFLKETDGQREGEKAPYRAAGSAVDGFFNTTVADKVRLQGERLQAVLKNYMIAKEAAERRRREEVAEAAHKEALRLLAVAQEAENKRLADIADAEETERQRLAALRPDVTSNPNADPAPAVQTEPWMPAVTMAPVNKALDEATAAAKMAEDATKAAQAKPAEMSRVKGERGSVSSLRMRWTGKMTDRATLDLEALRQHITEDAYNAGIRAWVKANSGENRPAPVLRGARIFQETML